MYSTVIKLHSDMQHFDEDVLGNIDPKIEERLVRLARSVEGRATTAANQIQNKRSEVAPELITLSMGIFQ